MRSVRRYLESQQLLTHPSLLTSRLLTSPQRMKQLRVTSSTRFYRYVRPESVDLHFRHSSTWSVEPYMYVAKPAVLKDYIVAPDCPLIDLHGYTLCEICIVATEIKSVLIGRPRSPPTPKTQSVYGPHLTPSLVGAGLTHSVMLHHFQLMIFWLRSRRR